MSTSWPSESHTLNISQTYTNETASFETTSNNRENYNMNDPKPKHSCKSCSRKLVPSCNSSFSSPTGSCNAGRITCTDFNNIINKNKIYGSFLAYTGHK